MLPSATGDIKFVDYNGDGQITSDDQVIIGRGDYPKLFYGIDMSVTWKGFGLSMLWQGAGLYDFNRRSAPDYTIPFYAGNTPITDMLNNAYVPENPWLPTNTSNVNFPLYRTDGYNRQLKTYSLNSDFWLINGSYLRLKNVELSYSLPKTLTEKVHVDNCKIFVSGYNVLTFSALDFMDPEMDTHTARVFGIYYPPVGTYNVGIQLQF